MQRSLASIFDYLSDLFLFPQILLCIDYKAENLYMILFAFALSLISLFIQQMCVKPTYFLPPANKVPFPRVRTGKPYL